jgi:hypothetical protein
LAIRSTEDVLLKGEYPIKYRAYFTNYPDNIATLAEPFVITIVDPCDAPVSVAGATLLAQEYTITSSAGSYSIPAFTADPAWCEITYTYSITDEAGSTVTQATFNPLMPFNDDPLEREFTFDYSTDLTFSGDESNEYTI